MVGTHVLSVRCAHAGCATPDGRVTRKTRDNRGQESGICVIDCAHFSVQVDAETRAGLRSQASFKELRGHCKGCGCALVGEQTRFIAKGRHLPEPKADVLRCPRCGCGVGFCATTFPSGAAVVWTRVGIVAATVAGMLATGGTLTAALLVGVGVAVTGQGAVTIATPAPRQPSTAGVSGGSNGRPTRGDASAPPSLNTPSLGDSPVENTNAPPCAQTRAPAAPATQPQAPTAPSPPRAGAGTRLVNALGGQPDYQLYNEYMSAANPDKCPEMVQLIVLWHNYATDTYDCVGEEAGWVEGVSKLMAPSFGAAARKHAETHDRCKHHPMLHGSDSAAELRAGNTTRTADGQQTPEPGVVAPSAVAASYGHTRLLARLSGHHPRTDTSAALHLIVGSGAAVTAMVIGHPFHTWKARSQLNTSRGEFKRVLDCVRQALSKEGARGVRNGMASSLVAVSLTNAMVFATYSQARHLLELRANNSSVARPLQLSEVMCAGAMAGIVNSVVVAPVELITCRLQAAAKATVGPLAFAKDIYNKAGIRGLYRGMSATMLREMTSTAGRFGVYEVLKTRLAPEGEPTANLGAARTVLAGGCAGTVGCLVRHPFDVVKSQVQLQPVAKRRVSTPLSWVPEGGSITCAKRIWRTAGVSGFWRGAMPCLMRAVPAHGAGFLAYEAACKMLATDE